MKHTNIKLYSLKLSINTNFSLGRGYVKLRITSRGKQRGDQMDDPRTKGRVSHLRFTDQECAVDPISGKKTVRLRFEEIENQSPPSRLADIIVDAPVLEAHRKISEVEDENIGVQAAHRSEQALEKGLRAGNAIRKNRKLKSNRATAMENKANQANVEGLYQQALRQNSELQSNPLSRWQQKQAIKRRYAAAKRAGQTTATAKKTAERATKTAKKSVKAAEKLAAFVIRNRKPLLIVLGIAVVVMLIMNAVSSCSMLFQGSMNMVISTSYTADDEDILAAEAYYTALESSLLQKIGAIETTQPGYDEYRYSLAEIGHDPFELMSYLTAMYEDFTIAEIKPELNDLFNRQYELTLTETVETRYRAETRIDSYTTTDPETGKTETHYYTYEVQVPYSYYILNVTLTNSALSRIASINLETEKLELYAVYMETRGNKPYLFADNIYAHPGEYTDYDIPPEALNDETFAALIREAEKYLGYPYVWGGSNPSESFDCSGFVCWVLNKSGTASVGRTNARGLNRMSIAVSPSEAKPGDLIFFTGARAAVIGHPVTHVGIYVGNGMMIHCASGGVQYSSIHTPYWIKNFYAFGRLNYERSMYES